MERIEKIEKTLEEIKDITKEFIDFREIYEKEYLMLRQISTDALLLSYENTKNIKKLSEELKALKDEMKAFKDEMKAFKDEINKKWGELANRLGTLTEDIFAPGIPYLVKALGYKVQARMLNIEYKKNSLCNQYDAIIVAKDNMDREKIFVAEVKSQLKTEHFEEFRKKLENLTLYVPSYEGKIVPILAAFKIPEELINLANKRKVLLVRMGGEYLEPLNPEVIEA